MEAWDAIRTRRNVRRFSDEPLPDGEVDRIVEAAALAPSSMNEQRWAFVVVRDRDRLRDLAGAGDYADHVGGAAATIAFLTPRVDDIETRESIAFDLGQAVENAMLKAWAAGIGSCHASVYDEPKVRRLLGYPEGLRCDLLVSFGYPRDPSSLRPPGSGGGRKPVADLRSDERFGA